MRFEPLDQPTTADAEAVRLEYGTDRDLVVRFRDWRKSEFAFVFRGTVAFRWDPVDWDGAPRNDEAYEVLDSTWLETLIAAGVVGATGAHRHFKLCFNAASVLDVIARGLEPVP